MRRLACHPKLAHDPHERRMERETGIEPATNSLEGCDSTTELLPPSRLGTLITRRFGVQARHCLLFARRLAASDAQNARHFPDPSLALCPEARGRSMRAKGYGEGRTRTFEATRATDLQSAAFDRFATSPTVCVWKRDVSGRLPTLPMELAKGFEPPTG